MMPQLPERMDGIAAIFATNMAPAVVNLNRRAIGRRTMGPSGLQRIR